MGKNKIVSIMIIILIAITLSGVVTYFVITNFTQGSGGPKEPSIDEILEISFDLEEMTTNLVDGSFVVIQLKIQTDSVGAKEELGKRSFQVKNILIQELASMDSEQFKSKEGLIEVEEILEMRINEILQKGTVHKVYIINRIVQ